MNRFMTEQWSMYDGTHKMRTELLDNLSDADLSFNPGGQNVPFGAVWREMGEVEYSYIQSFKTYQQDWSYKHDDPSVETSVSQLKAWFEKLDGEMQEALAAKSDEDFAKSVDRGFPVTLDFQVQIYLQAMLIFFGKAGVYMRALNKPLSKSFLEWIG